jgi:hypothetical protein
MRRKTAGIFTVDYPVYGDYFIVHVSPLVSINRVCVIIFVLYRYVFSVTANSEWS